MNKNLVIFHPIAEVHVDKELLDQPKLLKWLTDIPEEGPLCYQVCGGFYTYYLTPQLYREAIAEGLVAAPQQPLPVRSYLSMLQKSGLLTNMRINWALHHVTLDDLRKALARANEEPHHYEVQVYQTQDAEADASATPDQRLLLDLTSGSLQTLAADKHSTCFREVTDYASLLETLACTLGCRFMSGHHLREEFQQRGNSAFHNINGLPSTPEYTVQFLPLL